MPTSSRLVQQTVQAESIEVNNRVYEARARGETVIVLSLGEAFFDIPLLPMDDLPFPDVFHYSHSRGIIELRERLAEYFGERYDVPVDPGSEILITAGSKIAIHMTLMAILDPGDEVLIHEPAWVSYPEQIKLCGATPVAVPWNQTVHDFERHLTPRCRAIIVTNPHNPRGSVSSRKEIEHLLDLAREHDLWLLSDEAYSDFETDGRFVSLGAVDREKTHGVVFNSISKNYGISGWRMGYVIANDELIFDVLKVNQHLITCPPTILEHYIARHFYDILEITRPQMRAVVEKRAELATYMDEIGLEYLPGTATFYFFVSIAPSKLGSRAFCRRLLDEHRVAVVPGIGYGASCDAFVRVSVGTVSREDIRRGLHALRALIDATS